MKDEFISTVSHELRTPLTSLRAALGLVTGGALTTRPDKMQQMLEIAMATPTALCAWSTTFSISSASAAARPSCTPPCSSAEDLLMRAAALQQAAAVKANIRITCAANGVRVWADPDRILQTLTNLVSNAIKFSPPASTIHLAARALDENEALIEVRDQGRGIPADELENIFERFQQVDASDSRAMGGTGLGLAICRSIVTQHGGRIWATSTPGKGTTFHFTLPTKPSVISASCSSPATHPPLLIVLAQLRDHREVLERRRVALHFAGRRKLAQQPPHDLPAPRLRQRIA